MKLSGFGDALSLLQSFYNVATVTLNKHVEQEW